MATVHVDGHEGGARGIEDEHEPGIPRTVAARNAPIPRGHAAPRS
jgi:hypothetical protein